MSGIRKKRSSKRSGVPEELQDASRGERLQKVMAEAGVASRRDCEELIEQGRVRVNGQPVTALPAWVDAQQDRIEVDGQAIARPRKTTRRAATKTYIMLHKPPRVISTTEDPEGRTNVVDLIDAPVKARLFPVGRLDAESTGLILLTDDGEMANRLTHPRYEVPKQYEVSVRGDVTEQDVEKLTKGLFLAHKGAPQGEGARTRKAAMEHVQILGRERDRTRGDRTTLRVTLLEGQNREIRRLLARLGFKVRKLKRVAIGPLRLKGLAQGEWRMLTSAELRTLQKAAGMGNR